MGCCRSSVILKPLLYTVEGRDPVHQQSIPNAALAGRYKAQNQSSSHLSGHTRAERPLVHSFMSQMSMELKNNLLNYESTIMVVDTDRSIILIDEHVCVISIEEVMRKCQNN